MNHLLPRCALCGKTPPKDPHKGFRLAGKFICSQCEREIVSTAPWMREYERHVHAIKKVLYG